jgi:UDP-N-acetylenolpyruvoylglucosamine reductase
MLTIGLIGLGEEPGYAVGAFIPGFPGNTAPGAGELMVLEADEFDRSFLWLTPDVAIVTSVSFDHPDIYANQDDYDDAFAQFARNVKPGGTLVIAGDDPGCRRVVDRIKASRDQSLNIVTFGQGSSHDWTLYESGEEWTFSGPNGFEATTTLGTPGTHNARNAIAALAALVALGFEPAPALQAISTFTGVGRRFEHKGTVSGVDVVDDYAHHPEEIEAVIVAARRHFPKRRIVAVHQPHTYSRTKSLLNEFATALDTADEVVLLDIYPSGESDTLGVSSRDILGRLNTSAVAAQGPVDAAQKAAEIARDGDVVMTLGAGDITRTGALLLQHLTTKSAAGGAESTPRVRTPRSPIESFEMPGHESLKVMRNASMSMFTTMRLGGPADLLVRAPSPADIVAATRWAADEGFPVTIIGGGSNLLVGDGGIRGLVIVARTPGERAEHLLEFTDLGDAVDVTVGANAPLSWFGRFCAERGWSGMDWGVGLPGQVGGATVNNAGAHGTELKDHLYAIELLMANGDVERAPHEWLRATYRMTRIKGAERPRPWTVLRSIFRLTKADPAELIALADDHAAFRKRTQPSGACSGSTFANPPGDFAGRLLEAAGLKGHSIGAMQLSHKHANWVVNTGGGSAQDAWDLIRFARETVRDRFGVVLKPEIERIGEPWES